MKTPNPRIDRAVLEDRLQLALAAPQHSASWHWLIEAANAAAAEDRDAILETLRARRPSTGAGAILAATFLDYFAEDTAELVRANQTWLDGTFPLDAGLALLNVAFSRGLRSAGGSEGLAAQLRETSFLELSRRIGQRLAAERGAQGAKATAGAARGAAPRKVAVVTASLGNGRHAPTQMTLAHAGLLIEQGFEVQVFAAQELLMPNMAHWLGAPRSMALSAPDTRSWPRPKGGKLAVTLSKVELSMRGRWHSLLNALEAYAPEAILFVGTHSPLLWVLHPRYPIVGLGTSTLAPAGPIDLWLAPRADAAPTWSPPLPAPLVRAHTHRFSVALAQSPMARAGLGLPDGAPVWITSSTMSGWDFTPAWCARVREALERHPQAWWLVVGEAKDPPEWVRAGHPRVVPAAFQPELASVLLACDAYLNPPRMGGGHSVAMAMAHGLPVLSYPGGDGGDKLGPCAAPNEAAYFAQLDAWTRDTEARRAAGAAQRERFQTTLDLASAGPMLTDALAQAMQVRLAAVPPPT